VISPAICDEVLGALAYPKVRKSLKRDVDPDLWFEDIALLARTVAGDHQVTRVSEDPDDDVYLAAAIQGRCQYVVSGDPHLLTIGEYESIRIVTPRAFLTLLTA
jgi:uncharacterized protein